MQSIQVQTTKRLEMVDITDRIIHAIGMAGVDEGLAVVFSPHTTAAITLNENWDPDVVRDMLLYLSRSVPQQYPGFRHGEGNSDSHILTSLIGASVVLIIAKGKLQLGQWQGCYLMEFDGPRHRTVWVKTMPG